MTLRSLVVLTVSALFVPGCRLGPGLCLGGYFSSSAFMVGSAVDLRAGTYDILGECDRPAPSDLEWSSSDPSIATVEVGPADNQAVVRALTSGDVEISVQSGVASERWSVTVFPRIDRIDISPRDTVIALGDTVLYRAMAFAESGVALPKARVMLGPRPDSSNEWVLYYEMGLPTKRVPFNGGRFVAVKPGTVEVVGAVDGFSDTTTVTVVAYQ